MIALRWPIGEERFYSLNLKAKNIWLIFHGHINDILNVLKLISSKQNDENQFDRDI